MISLVTTVYNTPIEDLKRCFHSIQAQTYRDFEVIIIDDGSNQDVAAFLDSFSAEAAECFSVHHIANQGVSHARNLGMDYARGEYIAFCDSDDELAADFFQHSLKYVKTYKLDMISGGVVVKYKDHEKVCACEPPQGNVWLYTDTLPLLDYALSGYASEDRREFKNILMARVYPKLYRAEIAKRVRFPEDIRMSEDNLYSFAVFSICSRVGLTNECWYVYHQNEYSLTHNNDGILSHRQTEQHDFAMQVLKEKQTADSALENAYNVRLFHIFLNYLSTMLDSLSNLPALFYMRQTPWGRAIQQADFSHYLCVSSSDRMYSCIVKSPILFMGYCLYRYSRHCLKRLISC